MNLLERGAPCDGKSTMLSLLCRSIMHHVTSRIVIVDDYMYNDRNYYYRLFYKHYEQFYEGIIIGTYFRHTSCCQKTLFGKVSSINFQSFQQFNNFMHNADRKLLSLMTG